MGLSLTSLGVRHMNRLPREKQIQVISALTEGCTIRAAERMTGVHRDTITRLLIRTGDYCMTLMDDNINNVQAGIIECDEIWTYVGRKDHRFPLENPGPAHEGSQYIAVAMDRDTKLILSTHIGKRVPELAFGVVSDIKDRVIGKPTIVTDGWIAYFEAIAEIFGRDGCNFAQLVKAVTERKRQRVREGYRPAKVVKCTKYPIFGHVDDADISTSLIEQQNWTIRTNMRRLTRLSNGFSRKLENLKAASALHFATYNFTRIHRALSVTPAMAAGVTNSLWDVSDLVPHP